MDKNIQIKLGYWLRRDGGVERIVKRTDHFAYCWANKGGESWQDDGRLRSDKLEHPSDLIEYLGPIGHEICCLKPGSYLLSPEVYAGVKYQLGILNDDNCDSQEKWMASHALSEALNVNEPVVPDPLFDYTDDEKAVAKAIMAGELEIPSRVERIYRRSSEDGLTISCESLTPYGHYISAFRDLYGEWPLEGCDIDMGRVRECVRLMQEHQEELTSPKGRN